METGTFTPPSPGHHRFALHLQSALSVGDVEEVYLRSARDVVFARGTAMYRLDPVTGDAVSVAADVETSFLEDYERFGRLDDPVLSQVRETMRPVDSSRVGRQTVWEASGAWQCLNQAGYYHSMEAPVLVAGVPCATLNFARWSGDDLFGMADLRAAQGLAEQIGLALERALRYEETGRRATLLEDTLNHVPQAVVVTDLDANVIFTNRAARDGEATGDSLAATAHEAIEDAMDGFRRQNKRIDVASIGDSGDERLVVKSIRLSGGTAASLSLIYQYRDDETGRLPVWDVLSPREQEIAELVSHGLTTKEIAVRAFVTENTVKQHLKRIFAKTDVRNRAELMQRIWLSRKPEDGTARS